MKTNHIYLGSARSMKELPDNSVHCVITSPPYYNLRDYHVEPESWGSGTKQTWFGCLGMEDDPFQYIRNLVEVGREIRRVLRNDGTFYLNISDSYFKREKGWKHPMLKDGDLCMIPSRLAIALQEDGWWLVSEIVWAKTSSMPENAPRRPSTAHEKIYLFAKSYKDYYFDNLGLGDTEKDSDRLMGPRNVWRLKIPLNPDAAHFAVFPPDLVERCLKLGTSAGGCCPECLAPFRRIIQKVGGARGDNRKRILPNDVATAAMLETRRMKVGGKTISSIHRTVGFIKRIPMGWERSCDCQGQGKAIPAIVLDPFMGSGTTALVARENNREYVGYDLNPDYVQIVAGKRLEKFRGVRKISDYNEPLSGGLGGVAIDGD